jgi:hypothetical protein
MRNNSHESTRADAACGQLRRRFLTHAAHPPLVVDKPELHGYDG